MLLVPVAEAGPARQFAAAGSAAELIMFRVMERRPGVVTEAHTTGRAHRLRRSPEYLTLGGTLAAVSVAGARIAPSRHNGPGRRPITISVAGFRGAAAQRLGAR